MHMDLGKHLHIFLKDTIFFSLKPVISCPLKIIWPEVGSYNFKIVLPVVVLPHPDSPTNPKVSPLLIVKETLSTALTKLFFENNLCLQGSIYKGF